MTGISRHRFVVWLAIFVLGASAGAVVTWQLSGPSEKTLLPETLLHAVGTTSGETFAIATGAVDENAEGLFILDFLTGELQCWVPNYRTGRFYGRFNTNVAADLPVDRGKQPRYLLATGGINQRGATGNSRPAQTMVYVIDENTGNFASYSFMWNRTMASAGNSQEGQFTTVDAQPARTVATPP